MNMNVKYTKYIGFYVVFACILILIAIGFMWYFMFGGIWLKNTKLWLDRLQFDTSDWFYHMCLEFSWKWNLQFYLCLKVLRFLIDFNSLCCLWIRNRKVCGLCPPAATSERLMAACGYRKDVHRLSQKLFATLLPYLVYRMPSLKVLDQFNCKVLSKNYKKLFQELTSPGCSQILLNNSSNITVNRRLHPLLLKLSTS